LTIFGANYGDFDHNSPFLFTILHYLEDNMENVIGKEANPVILDEKLVKATTEAERMTKEYNELKKKRSISVKKTEKVSKTTRKEVTIMSARTHAEALLAKDCKEMKLSVTRIQAKSTSKSGIGAFQAHGVAGGVKVAVRDHDIVFYMPQKALGYGRQSKDPWVYCSQMRWDDADLEKAFRKALKDTRSGATWAKELGFARKVVATKIQNALSLEQKAKQLQAELKATKSALAKKRAKPKAVITTQEPVTA
jgi:hypothetical protein